MADVKKMAIVVHSGTLDKAYPPLMLAAAAGASDFEVDIFFTFWGLNLLKKKGLKKAKLSGSWYLMTPMMRLMIKRTGMASLPDLLEAVMETGKVRLWACTATMDIMMVKKKQLIDGLAGYMGAAGFLDIAADSDIQLFI
ncbi:MAG: DsrE/DsrF/DrsH-like family protein [Candidatus Heimdallarchaeota archaeon]|nr:DsrE/DsrF/DrsH-like family protein [Candidatus Heimdallarchaeota archaeon]MBY8995703.1 DsrE/DsrF/DrsH-like family protein [Candidatus Heimdallarchaeota archaeon]